MLDILHRRAHVNNKIELNYIFRIYFYLLLLVHLPAGSLLRAHPRDFGLQVVPIRIVRHTFEKRFPRLDPSLRIVQVLDKNHSEVVAGLRVPRGGGNRLLELLDRLNGVSAAAIADRHVGPHVRVRGVDFERLPVILDREEVLPRVEVKVPYADQRLQVVRILPQDLFVILDVRDGVQANRLPLPRRDGGLLLLAPGKGKNRRKNQHKREPEENAASSHNTITSRGSSHESSSCFTVRRYVGTTAPGATSAAGRRQKRRCAIDACGITSPGSSTTASPRRRMSTSSVRGPHRAPPRRPASSSSRFANASRSHGECLVAARTARFRNHGWWDRPNGSLAYIRETASSSVSRESRSTASRIRRTRLPWLLPRRRTASLAGGHFFPRWSLRRDDTVGEGADSAHVDGNDIPNPERPDAGGRSGRDHIPREQGHDGGDELHQPVDGRTHLPCIAVLADLAVHEAADGRFGRVEIGDDPRPQRGERVEPLGACILHVLHLEVARGHVIDAGVSEDVRRCVLLLHVLRFPADHHRELRLVIHALRLRRVDDLPPRIVQRGGRLEKQERLPGDRLPHLARVVPVIEAHRDDLPGAHRSEKPDLFDPP